MRISQSLLSLAIVSALGACAMPAAPGSAPSVSSNKDGVVIAGQTEQRVRLECDLGACNFFVHAMVNDVASSATVKFTLTTHSNDIDRIAARHAGAVRVSDDQLAFEVPVDRRLPEAAVGLLLQHDATLEVTADDHPFDMGVKFERTRNIACMGACDRPVFPAWIAIRERLNLWSLLRNSSAQYDPTADVALGEDDLALLGELPRSLPEVLAALDDAPFEYLTKMALVELSSSSGFTQAEQDVAQSARLAARALLRTPDGNEIRDLWEDALLARDVNIMRRAQLSLRNVTFRSVVDVEAQTRYLAGFEFLDAGDDWLADAWDTAGWGLQIIPGPVGVETEATISEEKGRTLSFTSTIDASLVGQIVERVLAFTVADTPVPVDRRDELGASVDLFLESTFGQCEDVHVDSQGLLDDTLAQEICWRGRRGLEKNLDALFEQVLYRSPLEIQEEAEISGGIVSDFDEGIPGSVIDYSFENPRGSVAVGYGSESTQFDAHFITIAPAAD